MDVTLDPQQRLVRESIRDLLQTAIDTKRVRELERSGEFDQRLWGQLAELGWLALPVPAEQGGAGGDLVSLGVVVEELARSAAIVPYFEVMTAAVTLARFGGAAGTAALPGLMDGSAIIVPALLDRADSYAHAGGEVQGDGHFEGERLFVDYGQCASGFLVTAGPDERQRLYLVDTAGARIQPLSNLSRLPAAIIEFHSAVATEATDAEGADFLLLLGRTLSAVQCLGYAQEALRMSTDYVKDRVQFGRPIGSFQAVQHHCANMAMMTESLRFLVYEALWSLDQGRATAGQIALAKAWASKVAVEVTALAHQLHGGIGVTEEYDLHFYSLRAKERSLAWGSYRECVDVVAAGIGRAVDWS